MVAVVALNYVSESVAKNGKGKCRTCVLGMEILLNKLDQFLDKTESKIEEKVCAETKKPEKFEAVVGELITVIEAGVDKVKPKQFCKNTGFCEAWFLNVWI